MDISMMVMQGLFMLIPSLLGSVIGAVSAIYKTQKSFKNNTQQANKLLVKMELRNLHHSIVVNGEGCTYDDKEDAEELYTIYKNLGGNGTGESLYNDIMKAKVTE